MRNQKAIADLEQLQGAWRLVDLHADNKRLQPLLGMVKVFRGNITYWLLPGDIRSDDFTFRIFPESSPKQMNMTSEEGTAHGIYRIDGDRLITCFAQEDGAERPIEFKESTENDWNLSTWARVSPENSGDQPGR